MEVYNATGRRKSSVARVRIKPGNGKITVNNREVLDYFRRETLKMVVNQPFEVTDTLGKFDVEATINGGPLRAGRRAPAGHFPRPADLEPGNASRTEVGRFPDPRSPGSGAEEIRTAESP